ncbi:hypothetical protein PMAYCL1PPCAC_04576 [Pristionchus mayeri]|uniref:SCP domain-containing protein n=1 Tax=Pristionchus mayeri TaxID=1317129 RepID=A0AAN4Z5D7_9BILA|nr:hypothetical protein PMAYCL1PPCAC_04576 [Pristionchus mayeri]
MLPLCTLLGLLSRVSLSHSQCSGGIPASMHLLCTLLGLLSLVSLSHSQCSGGIPASEVKGFLDVHNKMRQSISAGTYVAKGKKMPAAKTPIPNLTWDCEIEKSAQAVASTCVFAHSKNRKNLGENLYTYMSSAGVSFNGLGKAASDSWESEFKDYGWSDIKLTNAVFSSGVGHATQMAWAKSTKIGCGMATCNGGKQVIVACQYRDAGNMLGENVYDPK